MENLGDFFGYKVVEDNSVTELKLPEKVIDYLKNNHIAENVEHILRKEIKTQKFSGILYVPKEFIGKKAIIIILK
jgi:putative transposon-encoded protein